MKVIFLDIDGVLVTEKHLLDLQESNQEMMQRGHHVFDPECVENLRRITDATGAKIVISSAWRMFGLDHLRWLWKERSVPGEIIAITKDEPAGTRGSEIADWLARPITHGHDVVESFVIIDDYVADMLIGHSHRIIKTTWKNGLTSEHADQAIQILNNELINVE